MKERSGGGIYTFLLGRIDKIFPKQSKMEKKAPAPDTPKPPVDVAPPSSGNDLTDEDGVPFPAIAMDDVPF
jgi:hypothetical protein